VISGVFVDLSIVIPVYNEAASIRPLVSEIVAVLGESGSYEILTIDDGSEDRSLEEMRACREICPRLRILRLGRRCGQSTALHNGVLASRSDCIATLDGDGQNDPVDIPRLLSVFQSSDGPSSLQLVTGYRRSRRDGPVKRIASRIANTVRQGLLRDGTPDTGCGLKVFSRTAFLSLPQFDHMHRFLPALILRNGGDVLSVEVNHRPRAAGQSKYGVFDRLWSGIIDLFGVWWLQRRRLMPGFAQDLVEEE
jgi:dolichol-phosphate mannosyltransferase